MNTTNAKQIIESAGYQVGAIQPVQADIGHHKFRVDISGEHSGTYTASFQSDLERKWGAAERESMFGGLISPQREAAIYDLARQAGIPAPVVEIAEGSEGTHFLLEQVMEGKTVKGYIQGLPKDKQESAYLSLVSQVGELFAKASRVKFGEFGDVMGENKVANGRLWYHQRLSDIVTHNLAWNGHERTFTSEELAEVRSHLQEMLEYQETTEGKGHSPRLVLANLHRGNVYVNDEGLVTGAAQFNFAQAGVPAAEWYNAMWQFADASVANTADVEEHLQMGYLRANGVPFNPDSPENQAIMNLLTASHFLRAATIYMNKKDDPMRNRWGARFKDDILFPVLREGKSDFDKFSEILNEKWQ